MIGAKQTYECSVKLTVFIYGQSTVQH